MDGSSSYILRLTNLIMAFICFLFVIKVQVVEFGPWQVEKAKIIPMDLSYDDVKRGKPIYALSHNRHKSMQVVGWPINFILEPTAPSVVPGVSPGRGYYFPPAIYTREKERTSEV